MVQHENVSESLVDELAPKLQKRVKGKTSAWITNDIKKELNHRDSLMSKFQKSRNKTDHENFKRQRSKVNIIVRKAKNQNYQNQLSESAKDPDKFWKTLKSILLVNNKQNCVKSFLVDNVMSNDSSIIANGFSSLQQQSNGKPF